MTARIEPIRCACGRRGSLALRADCLGCGASYKHRVSKERLAVLRAIGAREPGARAVRIEPQMRIWFTDHRMIVATEPARPAREAPGRQRAPLPRGYRLTERGEMAIAEVATVPGWARGAAERARGAASENAVCREVCLGCKREIDRDTCHCGSASDDHNQGSGHSPVPMGCACHLDRNDKEILF